MFEFNSFEAHVALLGYLAGAVLSMGGGVWIWRYGDRERPDRMAALAASGLMGAWCIMAAVFSPGHFALELTETARNLALIAVISRLFRSLLFKPEVKAALSELLGGPAGCSNGQFFTKPARTGLGTMWHQDNAYFHLPDPVDGIAMWIVRLICCPRRTEL